MRSKDIRELSADFPKGITKLNILDNIAKATFSQSYSKPYVYSTELPNGRYGITIDESTTLLKNEYVKNFKSYGPNEKYLLNKVFYSSHNTFFLVGGIGTGKSRFIHFLYNMILPNKNCVCKKKCQTSGVYILIDFNKKDDSSFKGNDMSKISLKLLDYFSEKIRSSIDDTILSFEKEVTEVWDDIIKNKKYNNTAFDKIKNRLRKQSVDNYKNEDFKEVVAKRAAIYSEIEADKDLFFEYLSGLLRYIKEEYTNNSSRCIIITVDNLDPLSVLVQRLAMELLRRFFRCSHIKGIVAVRQSTARALLLDGYATADETVPNCSPPVTTVIINRLNDLQNNLDEYNLDIGLPSKDRFINNINRLKILCKKDFVKEFIESITGHSIRKGLILSERLICNSIYNIITDNIISTGDIFKAIMVGDKDAYVFKKDSEIDNVYKVTSCSEGPSLIKLRILRALDKNVLDDGFPLGKMVSLLRAYGYDNDIIRESISDMLVASKRLIWSDSSLDLNNADQILEISGPRLFISSAGIGYQDGLFSNISYVQETMFDIPVQEYQFENSLPYKTFPQRASVIYHYLTLLVTEDVKNVVNFLKCRSIVEYRRYWHGDCKLSLEIVQGISINAEKILDKLIDKSKSEKNTNELMIFRDGFLKKLKALQHECESRFIAVYKGLISSEFEKEAIVNAKHNYTDSHNDTCEF